jgi:hypothetical protein
MLRPIGSQVRIDEWIAQNQVWNRPPKYRVYLTSGVGLISGHANAL